MENQFLFSVIIPTCNRIDLLKLCLDSLRSGNQTESFSNYEIIVTDDGEDTSLKETLINNFSWVKYVSGPQKGPAANRNSGARYAKGKWLAFIDDDCVADKTWLKGFHEHINNYPDIPILEGRTYVNTPRKSLAEVAPLNTEGGYLWSCNFAIRRDLFLSLNGFDERFPYAAMEDVELRTRIINQGYPFHYVKDASVLHPWRARGGWRSLKKHEISTFIYLSLHPKEKKKINSKYYLKKSLRQFIKITLPGLFKFKGKGCSSALREHLSDLKMAFILLTNYPLK